MGRSTESFPKLEGMSPFGLVVTLLALRHKVLSSVPQVDMSF